VTFQASPRNKITVTNVNNYTCYCPNGTETGGADPNGGQNFIFDPQNLIQGMWTATLTNRLLLQATLAWHRDNSRGEPVGDTLPTDRAVVEQSLNRRYGSMWSTTVTGYAHSYSKLTQPRVRLSYLTGSHAFRVGFDGVTGDELTEVTLNYPEQYTFN